MVSVSEFRTGLCFSCRFELICCRYMWSNSERSNTVVYERLLKTSRDRSGRDPVFHPAESACSDYRFSPESRYGVVLTESLFPRAPALSHSEPVLAFTSPDSRTSPWAWKVPLPVWSSWKNDLVILAAPFRRSVSTICTESEYRVIISIENVWFHNYIKQSGELSMQTHESIYIQEKL